MASDVQGLKMALAEVKRKQVVITFDLNGDAVEGMLREVWEERDSAAAVMQ